MSIVELTNNKLVLDFTEETLITEGDDEAFISNTGQYIFTRKIYGFRRSTEFKIEEFHSLYSIKNPSTNT